jgi:hypothetical protein
MNGYYGARVRQQPAHKHSSSLRTHHKRLKVRPPPLRETVADLPVVVHAVARVELPRVRRRREALVEAALEPVELVLARLEVVAGELEERVRDLEHEDVRVPVVVDDEDALDGAPHAKVLVVVLQALQARGHGGVFFRLGLFGAGRA